MTKLKASIDIGPGDAIKDEMEKFDWSQKDLAEILDISEKQISLILTNKAPITPKIAMLLEITFGRSAKFWLDLNRNFGKVNEESCPYQVTDQKAEIFKKMPVRDMQKKGWLPNDKNKLFDAIKEFWGSSDLNLLLLNERTAKFKKSNAFDSRFNPFFAQTWVQKVIIEAKKIKDIVTYDKNKLKKLSKMIHLYSAVENGMKLFVNELRKTGVIFLIVPHLERTYTDGAAYWVGNNPVIALTGRYSRVDNFWFSLSHEIGHILIHEDKLKDPTPYFVDSIEKDAEPENEEEEKQANEFAFRVLKYQEIFNSFQGNDRISRIEVLQCAQELQIHPGIIVGYLQFHKMLSFSNLNELKESVKDILVEL